MEESEKISKNNATPYKSSWIDRFANWIRNLPGTSWRYYSGLGLFLLIVQVIVLWIEGGKIIMDLHPVQIYLSAAIPYILAIIPYFNDRALSALDTIKPALRINEDQFQEKAYQLSTLPAVSSVLTSILTLALVFITEYLADGAYEIQPSTIYPISAGIARSVYLICWWCFGTFCYHTIYQIGIINHIYTHHTKIDLFLKKPLYGFSNLTALKAGSLIILPLGFLFLNRLVILTDPVVLSIYFVISMIALLSFLLPQIGIHRIQNEEKERLLEEAIQRYKISFAELHELVDKKNLEGMMNLNLAINSLTQEIKAIEKISTWPWEPETFRWLLTAMVLPLLLWVTQYFLGQWLSQ